MTKSIFCFLAILLAMVPPARGAQTTTAPTTAPASFIELTTERIVVFKDGHGLVIKRGKAVAADDTGRAYTDDVPDAAVLGTFWAVSDGDGDAQKILGMRAEWVESEEKRTRRTACVSMVELLRANVGKTLTLELSDRNPQGGVMVAEGKLLEVLDVAPDPSASSDPRSALRSNPGVLAGFTPPTYTALIQSQRFIAAGSFTRATMPPEGGTLVRDIIPRGGDFLVLAQENDKRLVLPVAKVQSIRAGGDVVTTIDREQELFTRTKRLSFDFGRESAGKPVSLHLMYFTPGLRWIPTYRLSGELKDSCDLALQGEILNEVTDIDHAALDLVVGVPHFRFEDTVSPLTLEQTMRVALASAGVNIANNGFVQSQFAMDNRARVAVEQPATIAPELLGSGGGAEQDLFVYPLKDFSLKKGARATVPLWKQQAPLRHLYTLDLATRRNRSGGLLDDAAMVDPNAGGGGGVGPRRSPNRIVMNQVWHQLELTNGGDVPWTTGAALLLRGTLPLGQDLLVYTPPGGRTLVPVTVAVDVRGSLDEQEISRDQKALHFDGSDYVLVRKKGTVTINSYRKEKSTMKITLATGGKVESASDAGKVVLNDARNGDWDDSGVMRVNNHSDVTWDLSVEPGKTVTVTYEVSFYTR